MNQKERALLKQLLGDETNSNSKGRKTLPPIMDGAIKKATKQKSVKKELHEMATKKRAGNKEGLVKAISKNSRMSEESKKKAISKLQGQTESD